MDITVSPFMVLVAAPIAAGVLFLLAGRRIGPVAGALASIVAFFAMLLSIYVFVKGAPAFEAGGTAVFGADHLSAFIGATVAFFTFVTAVYSIGFVERDRAKYFAYFLITAGSSLGAVYAANLLVLLVFWGILAMMLFLLVAMGGEVRAVNAARKALIIIGGTDAMMLFGIGLIWFSSGTLSIDKMRLPLSGAVNTAAYITLAAAALAKAGCFPFHSWLPDVAEDGPVPVTAYLPASLDKLLGIYLLVRASTDIFVMNGPANAILALVGSVTIVFAVGMALVQHDMKRLLGYHAVSQVGYMVLGIGTGNPIGIAGGIFHMLNNAIYKSCLFMTGGSVEKRTGTSDLGRLGGLARYMGVTFVACLIAALSISGIPPFNGFVSKWMIYQGIIGSAGERSPLWIVWLSAAMFGSALTLASFMKLIHAVYLGRPARDFSKVREAPLTMVAPAVALAALCLIFGVFAFKLPLPALIAPSVKSALSFSGSWSPVASSALIAAALLLGAALYMVKGRLSGFRRAPTFVGGEDPASMPRISGTEFYNSVSELKSVRAFYAKAEKGGFDPYLLCGNIVMALAGRLKRLHNGVLPTYLVWCLLGMAAMLILALFGVGR